MVEHLGVVFVDDNDARVHRFRHRQDVGRLVVGDDRDRVVLQTVHQQGAVERHQGALLSDRCVDHAVLDELQRAVVAVHGHDLQLAVQAKFLRGSRGADATSGFHTAHAGQIRLALEHGLQGVRGLRRVALVVDDLDQLDIREILGQLVLVALDAFFQVALPDLRDDRNLALAADQVGKQLAAHPAGVVVAGAQERHALGAVDFGVQRHDRHARVDELVDRRLECRVEADDVHAVGVLGRGLFHGIDHGRHVVLDGADELGLGVQDLAGELQADAMVDEVRQVGESQGFDVGLLARSRRRRAAAAGSLVGSAGPRRFSARAGRLSSRSLGRLSRGGGRGLGRFGGPPGRGGGLPGAADQRDQDGHEAQK